MLKYLLLVVLLGGCQAKQKEHYVFKYTAHIYVEQTSIDVTVEAETSTQAAGMLTNSIELLNDQVTRERLRRPRQ